MLSILESLSRAIRNFFLVVLMLSGSVLLTQCSGTSVGELFGLDTLGEPIVELEINYKSSRRTVAKLRKYRGKGAVTLKIDSFGGSVVFGHDIIEEIKYLQANGTIVTCIADQAMSMGFTILQYCDLRYAYPDALIMQHMPHNGNGFENMVFRTEESKVQYAFFVRLHGEDEARRLGIPYSIYIRRYMYSKWYKGKEACRDRVIDGIIDYNGNIKRCSK